MFKEVLIIAMTAIKKIDALAACPRLNYLEFQTSAACDLTPLKGLRSLRNAQLRDEFQYGTSPLFYEYNENDRRYGRRFEY